MNEIKRMEEIERCQTIVIDGVTLKVIARRIENNEWELCVENSYKIKSIWTDLFDSAENAISSGLKAIETEGVEEFCNADDFGYLQES